MLGRGGGRGAAQGARAGQRGEAAGGAGAGAASAATAASMTALSGQRRARGIMGKAPAVPRRRWKGRERETAMLCRRAEREVTLC